MEKNKFSTKWFYVPCESETEIRQSWFGKAKEIKHYDARTPDVQAFADRVQDAYNAFDDEGYDVINVIPLNVGSSEHCNQSNGNYVGDVGFTPTRGAVIVGKRRDS